MFDSTKSLKTPDEMELTDDAMFTVTMRDLELVRLMLSYILDREVVSVKAHTVQDSRQLSPNAHGVRFDVYVEGEDEVYDIEMQLDASKAPGRRARFYSSTIDYDHLSKGEWYTKLPHVYVIFFTTADPLGEGLALQRFTVRSEESNGEFDFGLTYMYYNINFQSANVSARMEEFLTYLRDPRRMATTSNDPLVRYAERSVQESRANPTVRRDIMLMNVKLWDAKEEGREEGRIEGRSGLDNDFSRVIPLIYAGKSKAEIMQLTGVSIERTPSLSVLWGYVHGEDSSDIPFEEELVTAEDEVTPEGGQHSGAQCDPHSTIRNGLQHMNL